jgi:type VI secretion system secreted protein VgrG
MAITQDKRVAQLQTALGKDVLGLARFEITEGLSELFEWQIEAVSEKPDLDFKSAIGRPCSITVKSYDTDRLFHGILAEARWVGVRGQYHVYRAEVVPWLWLLSRVTNCRIFSEKSAPDIIQEVFQKQGFTDFRMSLSENHPTREYCVQYRESDLAFVSRLMEEEGIFYYFEHSSDKHTLVMVDSNSACKPVPNRPKIPFIPSVGSDWAGREHLHDWYKERRFRSGKVVLNDYNFKQPNSSLKAEKEAAVSYNRSRQSELYDHPGNYKERSQGEQLAKVRLEAEQALDNRRYGSGEAVTLFPGGLVTLETLEQHNMASENRQYLVVRASHRYVTEGYASAADAAGAPEAFDGDYEFLPSDQPYRSPMTTPRPLVYGMHTAKVVGPSGEEIHVDEHGRIRVEFFWDRDKSQSRWARVAHLWAGKEWGFQYIPRIGMEVCVVYEDGDPDHPIVIGAVYNGDNKHPYSLPANKTQSGVKSNSSKGGGGYNEFMFEDKKAQEKIRMHAEKDHEVKIRNSETWEIGEIFMPPNGSPSRKTDIKNGDDVLTIDMGNQETNVKMGYIKETAFQKIELICGQSKITMTPFSIDIESLMITIKGQAMTTVQAPMTTVKGDAILTLKGGLTLIN